MNIENAIRAGVGHNSGVGMPVQIRNVYLVECFDRDGNLKWVEEIENLVATTGLNDILNQWAKGSGYTAAFYVGLTDGTPVFAAGDTMGSHGGWTEFTEYDESTREALTLGTVSSGSVDNSASKAGFSINSDSQTAGGAFIATDSTIGGTSGTFIGGAAFSANRGVNDGDTINVTVTLSVTSA